MSIGTTVRRRFAAALACAALAAAALTGCSFDATEETAGGSESASAGTAVEGAQSAATVLAADKEAHDADLTEDASDAVDIALDGDSASVRGDGAEASGATVTITSGGTYRITGTLTDGQVVVDAPDATVRLVLDGARISSSTGAALAATDVDELVVVLADGTTNTLSDAPSHAEDAEVNAALFSAGDLTVGGGGTLTVKGNGGDGIASRDGLVLASGTIRVTAADDGVRGKDYLVVEDGELTVEAGGDGLTSDNEDDEDSGYVSLAGGAVDVTARGDGVAAATDLVVTGGRLTVAAGGGSGARPADDTSAKGVKAGVIAVLEEGTIAVDSADDAVHSDGAVHFAGATVTAASGDDGVHAEGDLVLDDGTVKVTRAEEGLEGKDIVVAGGSVSIVASDDGINASGGSGSSPEGGRGGGEGVGDFTVTVSGGSLVVDSEGDGLDSNGTAEITGGTVVVNGPQQGGNGALDVNGSLTVSGGTLLAAGSAGMAVAPDEDSGQGWLSATLDSSVPAGTTLHVVDADGAVVATYITAKQIQNVVYSSSAITSGATYRIYSGGSTSATDGTGGLYTRAGTLGSAEEIAAVTAGDAPQGGGFGGGGGPGGGRR
ncbi:carbohydrate-binding domain-containing protein [Streptomyces sp. NBC_00582]|uniref:carbohydrate-binding domain-containing protein n=1 Tax=Streptomyces sp. NBC_00582 TaxID=2975783 RepID=UPI002E7FCABC|nr:carbohydrate-binding domain-containing protein [Streptomyces sp. NBC_00582]WUB63208.1 carbohydrate-binding domain-containing protein [Streptomyces sp. NBC_00582]